MKKKGRREKNTESTEVASSRWARVKGRGASGMRGDQGTTVTKGDNKIKAIDRSV